MSAARYVIVGAGGAGMSAARTIAALDPEGAITVLSEEPFPPYYRPMIPFLLEKKRDVRGIALDAGKLWEGGDRELRLSTRVEGIDGTERTVTIRGGETIPYDACLIAAGAKPMIPEGLENTRCPGVFTLRSAADAEAAAERAASARHVVLLGAGLVSLKAALSFRQLGLDVTLVEREASVLPRLMDPEAGVKIQDALVRLGVRVETGHSAREIQAGPDGVRAVVLDDGREIACEMVCIATGVRPNIAFLEKSGVELDVGVVTDRYTRTSVPGIYGAGDVAVTFDAVTGQRITAATWTNAVEMGRCAGRNMAGGNAVYPGSFPVLNAAQVGPLPFVAMGWVRAPGEDCEVHVRQGAGWYRKVVFSPEGTRLVGTLLMGDIARAGIYRALIREGRDVSRFKRSILDHALHYGHFQA